ncbi:hypothetical protein CCMA1212_001779, partial [Trichoderma ghanense]
RDCSAHCSAHCSARCVAVGECKPRGAHLDRHGLHGRRRLGPSFASARLVCRRVGSSWGLCCVPPVALVDLAAYSVMHELQLCQRITSVAPWPSGSHPCLVSILAWRPLAVSPWKALFRPLICIAYLPVPCRNDAGNRLCVSRPLDAFPLHLAPSRPATQPPSRAAPAAPSLPADAVRLYEPRTLAPSHQPASSPTHVCL